MNPGGDTADQMMKMTLEGIEVASRVVLSAGGSVSKSLAATLYAILTDNKKVRGKARLDSMLKSSKELKVFAIRHDDLKVFCQEAKKVRCFIFGFERKEQYKWYMRHYGSC